MFSFVVRFKLSIPITKQQTFITGDDRSCFICQNRERELVSTKQCNFEMQYVRDQMTRLKKPFGRRKKNDGVGEKERIFPHWEDIPLVPRAILKNALSIFSKK